MQLKGARKRQPSGETQPFSGQNIRSQTSRPSLLAFRIRSATDKYSFRIFWGTKQGYQLTVRIISFVFIAGESLGGSQITPLYSSFAGLL
jgi:hypothetical protein